MIRKLYAVTLLTGGAYLAWSIVGALQAESMFTAGARLVRDPWGWVTLIDLYLGFLVVGGLIVWRERRVARWLPWLVAMFCLGNLATALYIARWLTTSADPALPSPAVSPRRP